MENESSKKENITITQPKCFLSENNTDFELLVSPNRLSVKTRKDYGFEWLWKSRTFFPNLIDFFFGSFFFWFALK